MTTRKLLIGLLLVLGLVPAASALTLGSHVPADGTGGVQATIGAQGAELRVHDQHLDLRTDSLLTGGAHATASQDAGSGNGEDVETSDAQATLQDAHSEQMAKAAGAAGLAVLVTLALSKLEALRSLKNGGALLLAPLYSRIGRSEILDNGTRREIFELVKAEPGIAMKDVSEEVGCGWGTVVYHLERLEDTGFVASRKAQGSRRFFAVGDVSKDEREAVGLLRKETPHRIAHHLLEHPGANQSELCDALGIAASTASKHLGRMEEADLVTREREWRSVHYYPSDVLTQQVAAPATATTTSAPKAAAPA